MNIRRLFVAALIATVLTGCDFGDNTPAAPGAGLAAQPAAQARVDVWVEDHTGKDWPVDAATLQWDAGLTATIRYGPCHRGVKCVKVREGGAFKPDEVGKTTLFGTIRMNPAYAGLPADQLLAAVCHEEGHALGLRHNEDPDSCMNAQVGEGTSTGPGARDLAALNAKGVR